LEVRFVSISLFSFEIIYKQIELIEKQSKFPNFILINYTKKSLKFNRTAKNSLKCNNNIKSN